MAGAGFATLNIADLILAVIIILMREVVIMASAFAATGCRMNKMPGNLL